MIETIAVLLAFTCVLLIHWMRKLHSQIAFWRAAYRLLYSEGMNILGQVHSDIDNLIDRGELREDEVPFRLMKQNRIRKLLTKEQIEDFPFTESSIDEFDEVDRKVMRMRINKRIPHHEESDMINVRDYSKMKRSVS